ncbi:MAG: chromate transporter [Intestinibacter sp.]
MNILLDLFLTFARIGGFTFGGGYAMLPILQRDIVETKKWATEEELMDYYAIGQCTPGIISVNVATFIGYKLAGIPGGIIATLGTITPSIIIITIIAAFLTNFADLPIVIHAFNGIRVCVCILIINAIIKLGKKSIVDKLTLAIFIAVSILSIVTKLSPIIYVIVSGIIGALIYKFRGGKEEC